ncbi:MAG TPA: redoxin family protein [Verrucomicrobiae bacterium]
MSRVKTMRKVLAVASLAGVAVIAGLSVHGQSVGDLEKRFRELDKDKDEKLTTQELTDKEWFARLDKDKDGIVALQEVRDYTKAMKSIAKAGANGEGLFVMLDRNGDGKLTRDELPRPETFDQLDVNGDGGVTLEEAKTVLANVNAMRGKAKSVVSAPKESPREGPKQLKGSEVGVGRMVPDVAFTDVNGKAGKLSDLKSGKALVIAFTTTSCPVGKRYSATLAKLEKEYAAKGVTFLYVNPTETDTLESIREDVKAHGFKGRYVHDKADAFHHALHAKTTTEVFVLDAARTLIYRGAIDDQYGLGYSRDEARDTYLTDALNAFLKGQVPEIAATTAPGCALEVKESGLKFELTTYHHQISRIMQNNCVECHRKGGVAPFGLETYEEVKAHAGMISKQVERGAMPPWFATPAPHGEITPWANERSLTELDKMTLLNWLKSDKPVGNPADAPIARTYPAEWLIGEPDLVVQIPQPIVIKATGTMPYSNISVETGLTEDKWVQGFEIQPTAREAVHHVLVFVRPPKKPAGSDSFDDERAERDGFFAAYVPGNSSQVYPAGMAKKLPAGSRLHFQIHYTPTGKATTDRIRVGVVFAKEEPKHVVQVAGISNPFINIPPGAANHAETAQIKVPADVHVFQFMPHMHLRGKAAKYEVIYNDGTKNTLLDIPHYDFNWQLVYRLAEPLFIPAGATIKVTMTYDNSAGNPANPDPNKNVRWGQQTYDEMMLGYIAYYTPSDRPMTGKSKQQAAR